METIDLGLIRSVAREASRAGIGMDAAVALLGDRVDDDPARLATLIARLEAAIAASPLPGPELGVVRGVYPDPLLADLLGISEVSLRRYAAGERSVPDVIAGRIHAVALVTSDLAGKIGRAHV